MLKLIIMDFDGVIIESVDLKTEAFRELFQEYHEYIDDIIDYHVRHHAFSRYVKFKYIYENILKKPYTPEVERDLGQRFSYIVYQKVVTCPYVPGALEFLKFFAPRYPIYLASNTPQQELERIVAERKIQQYFKRVFGSPPGNKIEFIHTALTAEHAQPQQAIYIGDMREDYNVARKTGVKFIGRKNIESFDDFCVPNFPNLLDIKEWIVRDIKEK
ncbi:MAG: HAD hydrolase-like protein [Candidatus Thermoplasmatota archaeon]